MRGGCVAAWCGEAGFWGGGGVGFGLGEGVLWIREVEKGGGGFNCYCDLGFDTNSLIFLFSRFETARLHPSDSDDRVPTVNSQSFIKQKKKLLRNI